VHTNRSEVIDKLTQEDTEITRKIFERMDETAHSTEERLARRNHNIDPYWDPFRKVEEVREKVVAEFDEYSKLVSVAEAKEIRTQVRRALIRSRNRYDSYSLDYRRWLRRMPASKIPVPHKLHESFWEQSGLQKQLARERITWRDPDILQHFRAANGFILPRRLTKLSKRKQYDLVKAVRVAQQMAVIPFDWNSRGSETMPLMDPVEWMSYRLSRKVEKDADGKIHKDSVKNIRATAMMTVLENSEPNLRMNYFRHLLRKRNENEGENSSVRIPFEDRLRAVIAKSFPSDALIPDTTPNGSGPHAFHGH
jgi:ribosomal protein S18